MVAATGVTVLEGEAGRDAGVVVVSGHRDFDYAALLTAKRALDGGAALIGTSRDPTMPMPGGEWPGTGAILAAVETASGKTAEIAGKPERHLFEMALAALGGPTRVAMVGDRLSSDIDGGRRRGLATILVSAAPAPAPRPGRPSLAPTTSSTTSPRCCGERAGAGPRRPGCNGPALAFAGLFAVTFCGLLVAVGAVLPVLPRYVHGPLGAATSRSGS